MDINELEEITPEELQKIAGGKGADAASLIYGLMKKYGVPQSELWKVASDEEKQRVMDLVQKR